MKTDIRKAVLERRAALAEEEKIEASLILRDAVDVLHIPADVIVSGYLPIRGELDPRPLMSKLQERGCTIVLPTMIGDDLVFRRLDPTTELVNRGFGTMGPPDEAEALDPDVLLVPLAAFDQSGHRIGYGRGFYDRALARLRAMKPVRAIGLAFSIQEVPKVPVESHDSPLDGMLTEHGFQAFAREIGA